MKISERMRDALRRMSAGWEPSGITDNTLVALEKRGLAEWKLQDGRPWGGFWKITDAGRQALSSYPGGHMPRAGAAQSFRVTGNLVRPTIEY